MKKILLVGALSLALVCQAQAQSESSGYNQPVKVVADKRLEVKTDAGQGLLPLYVSADWTQAQPQVTRAVVVFHGRLRNADVYLKSAQEAMAEATAGKTSLLVVPQFLEDRDVTEYKLPVDVLHWKDNGWMGGEPATGFARLSSFDAIDAILSKLTDRELFPQLKQVILVGHSGGGQLLQRYAVVGQGDELLKARNVPVRYVVANPSSYLYFTETRPDGKGGFSHFNTPSCPDYNDWRYGWESRPSYAKAQTTQDYEQRYAQRDVIYLLGGQDTDPKDPSLDKSCGAEAQGAYRYARGRFYFDYLRTRYGRDFHQRVWDVPVVGHDAEKMFTSSCGLAAVFDVETCGEMQ